MAAIIEKMVVKIKNKAIRLFTNMVVGGAVNMVVGKVVNIGVNKLAIILIKRSGNWADSMRNLHSTKDSPFR